MDKQTIYDIKDVSGRAKYIRKYLEKLSETDSDVLNYKDEFKKFVDELSDNLSKLRIVDLVVSYNPYDKTIDSVWKLIGGYTLSIAQFFTDSNEENDDLVVFSIHSPERELLVSADMTLKSICDTLLELEPEWNIEGQPERICEKFGRFDMHHYMQQIKAERAREDEEERNKHFPVRVSSIIKRIVKKMKIWETSI